MKKRRIEAQKSLKVFKSGVGKYINPDVAKGGDELKEGEVTNKKKKASYNFNFNNW